MIRMIHLTTIHVASINACSGFADVRKKIAPRSLSSGKLASTNPNPLSTACRRIGSSPASGTFAQLSPHLARWLQAYDRLEIGYDAYNCSFVPALDIGGLIWEGRVSRFPR
jgi:hypothetical protein